MSGSDLALNVSCATVGGMEDLSSRVLRLEAELRELSLRVGSLQSEETAQVSLPPAEEPAPLAQSSSQMQAAPQLSQAASAPRAVQASALDLRPALPRNRNAPTRPKGEALLKRGGIALVLFGLALLFKYSIDQGWLSETLRVLMGLGVASTLFGIGLHTRGRRRNFGQIMMGGGIAAFYMTAFAAYQLYGLVPHAMAFAFMAGITTLAGVLSVQQRESHLAVIGALGGLATPFLLSTGSNNISALLLYLCVLLAGTSAVYLLRGWRSLLWVSWVGAWAILLFALVSMDFIGTGRPAILAGLACAWVSFFVLPMLRQWKAEQKRKASLVWMTLLTPLLCWSFLQDIWNANAGLQAWHTEGFALVSLCFVWKFRKMERMQTLVRVQAALALLFQTVTLFQVFDGTLLLVALLAEVALVSWCSRQWQDAVFENCSHLLSLVVAGVLGLRLVGHAEAVPLWNLNAWIDLGAIGAALVLGRRHRNALASDVYAYAVHLGFLTWLYRELSPLPNGQGLVTIAWGVYAIALLIVGLRRNRGAVRTVAMATLLLVVGKLFAIDLETVDTIWRILLFLGFGGGFLAIGYFFQTLWLPEAQSESA